jgi:hypothetical protein
MDYENYEYGMFDTVAGLAGAYRNVFIDIQNEMDLNCLENPYVQWKRDFPYYCPVDKNEITYIGNNFDYRDTGRLNMASTGDPGWVSWYVYDPSNQLDIVAYHDPRTPGSWYSDTASQVSAVAAKGGKPIYFQEPMPWQDDGNRDHFLQAAQNAKNTGAAAWTFHTRTSFILDGSSMYSQLSSDQRYIIEHIRSYAPW